MKLSKRLWALALLFAFVLGFGISVAYAQSQEETEQALIAIVATSDDFAGWLEQYPDWNGYAHQWEDDSSNWYVDFYDSSGDEWLGYANINGDTGEIFESFVPRPLSPEVYQDEQPRIQMMVLDDPEVQARLIDLALWDYNSDFNRFEQKWEVYIYRGTEAILVRASIDENNNFTIHEIIDPNQLSEEEADQHARDQAIALAYTADGVGEALEGYDNWRTYVQHQGGTRWSVTFEANGEELFYALVDIALDRVIESAASG
jgi:hypothetical protein